MYINKNWIYTVFRTRRCERWTWSAHIAVAIFCQWVLFSERTWY